MEIIIQIKTMNLILDIFKTIIVFLVGVIIGYHGGKIEDGNDTTNTGSN